MGSIVALYETKWLQEVEHVNSYLDLRQNQPNENKFKYHMFTISLLSSLFKNTSGAPAQSGGGE